MAMALVSVLRVRKRYVVRKFDFCTEGIDLATPICDEIITFPSDRTKKPRGISTAVFWLSGND
ncbi:hypothetical protein AUP42_05285 [Thalassospira lucentensis]|uniref:Uncharacterized protein n=1 Tax=Thalassospira lucentensis TaxID=168935 RepID=A0A154L2X1_9PROT|nr:hypothetical protein AUP42_05285 [Thalassospira lucentensis]